MDVSYTDVAKMIDHSLLRPTLTEGDLETGCRLAVRYDVASVCIMPYWLRSCSALLEGTSVVPSTTIGFPHGGHTTAVKRAEAEQALADGGKELDMVVNISQVLSENWEYVHNDIAAVVEAAHQHAAKVKVIFENCFLEAGHKIRLCKICSELGVDWVKTSTGYGSGGSVDDDLVLMREHAAANVQIKAAGGIHDLDALLRVRALGVTRVGASRTKEILDECRYQLGLTAFSAVQRPHAEG